MKPYPMYALILAGGRGTRFWPRSRRSQPKQVLSIVGEGTLLQQTVARVSRLVKPENIFVITGEHLRAEVLRQLPTLPKEQIVAEPLPRNTAPCIGLGAQLIRQRDANAVMGVFPADHAVMKPARFLTTIRSAYRAAAEANRLVVIGIPPRWAETGYGYLEFPKESVAGSKTAYAVKSFREKPDAKTAAKYVKAGNYYWNSGMFFWQAETFLDALNSHMPKTALQLESIAPLGSKRFERDLAEFFPLCESISVDFGVMEKASNVAGITADDFGWSDVGSWKAVYELSKKDREGNVARDAEIVALEAAGNYVDGAGKTVALVGVDDLVVVETRDALLVTRKDLAHRVGDLVKLLEKRQRNELL